MVITKENGAREDDIEFVRAGKDVSVSPEAAKKAHCIFAKDFVVAPEMFDG
jgi:hypothetical protein